MQQTMFSSRLWQTGRHSSNSITSRIFIVQERSFTSIRTARKSFVTPSGDSANQQDAFECEMQLSWTLPHPPSCMKDWEASRMESIKKLTAGHATETDAEIEMLESTTYLNWTDRARGRKWNYLRYFWGRRFTTRFSIALPLRRSGAQV